MHVWSRNTALYFRCNREAWNERITCMYHAWKKVVGRFVSWPFRGRQCKVGAVRVVLIGHNGHSHGHTAILFRLCCSSIGCHYDKESNGGHEQDARGDG